MNYLLMRVVAYKGLGGMASALKSIQSDQTTYGHYSTFIYKRGNTVGMEADALKDKTKYIQENYLIVPWLLMYIKNKLHNI